MKTLFKNLTDPKILAILLAVLFITMGIVYFYRNKQTEGFYPLTQERIDYADRSKRMYNDYADMIPITQPSIIPRGEEGDSYLNKLLASPVYEGSKDSQTLSGLNYNYKSPYKAPPENAVLMARIAKCESVKDWDCEAFNDPEFMNFCGICTKDGKDHNGKQHIGGLYIDNYYKDKVTKDAKMANKPPVYKPSAGVCNGEFLMGRPYCDTQKDRDDCTKVRDFTNPDAVKCALCVNSEDKKFVYVGSRGNQESNYALTGKPFRFTARLRFAVTHPNEATIVVTKKADNSVIVGSFINNSNVYICDIPNASENDEYNISVRYPEYKDHVYTNDEKSRLKLLQNPPRPPLISATWGPLDSDRFYNGGIQANGPGYMRDDPRAIDATQQIQANYKNIDCSKIGTFNYTSLDNNKLGGDPAVFIRKQLKIKYGNDPQNAAYKLVVENDNNEYLSSNFSSMCQNSSAQADAEKQICETDSDGTPIITRNYTGGNNTAYFGTSKAAKCVETVTQVARGIVGIWESLGTAKRTVPLAKSVIRINGFDVGDNGVPLLGTIKSSKLFREIAPESRIVGIPPQLFWFWAKDENMPSCNFSVVVPATLRDPTIKDDMKLCPSGPLISTTDGSKRMSAGACEAPVNGQPQGPGNYSAACIQSLFLNVGCSKIGKAFPNGPEKLNALLKDPSTGDNNGIDDIENIIKEMYTIAKTTKNSSGLQVDDSTLGDASMKCFGKLVTNPCDTPFKETGPQSVSCLNYLYRNAGKDNDQIGQTYPGVTNRSSGSGRTDKTPVLYCQTAGSMSPIGADGKANTDAVQQANSYGGVNAIREFYKQIHTEANFSKDPVKQRQALAQCYGVGVSSKKPACKGTTARYVRILPTTLTSDSYIQISQISVYDIYDNNVSIGKPVKSSSSLQNSSPATGVDGVENPRAWPQIWHSADGPGAFWEVDLKKNAEIAYIIYNNRNDCCNIRAKGMRVQIMDENRIVVKEKTLSGSLTETVMFSNAKPAGLLKPGMSLKISPHSSPGGVVTIVPGGEILVKTNTPAEANNNSFITVSGPVPGTFMFKDKFSNKYLRVQGFRVRASENDNTNSFKQEVLFKVVDSLSANDSEISVESVSKPGSYLAIAENNGVYISPATTFAQQKACSWRIVS